VVARMKHQDWTETMAGNCIHGDLTIGSIEQHSLEQHYHDHECHERDERSGAFPLPPRSRRGRGRHLPRRHIQDAPRGLLRVFGSEQYDLQILHRGKGFTHPPSRFRLSGVDDDVDVDDVDILIVLVL